MAVAVLASQSRNTMETVMFELDLSLITVCSQCSRDRRTDRSGATAGEVGEHKQTSTVVWWGRNKYGTVQELRSTFSHIKTINIDFSLVWFVSLYVDF